MGEEEGHKENTKIRIIKSIFLPNACHGYLFRSEANTQVGWFRQYLQQSSSTKNCSGPNLLRIVLTATFIRCI